MSENVDTSQDVRAELEREQELLQAKVHELDSSEDELTFDGGFADSAQVAAEQGENRALFDQLRKELDDVEHALERLDAGTYGTCEVCSATIGEARLDVMPATRFCIDHA